MNLKRLKYSKQQSSKIDFRSRNLLLREKLLFLLPVLSTLPIISLSVKIAERLLVSIFSTWAILIRKFVSLESRPTPIFTFFMHSEFCFDFFVRPKIVAFLLCFVMTKSPVPNLYLPLQNSLLFHARTKKCVLFFTRAFYRFLSCFQFSLCSAISFSLPFLSFLPCVCLPFSDISSSHNSIS